LIGTVPLVEESLLIYINVSLSELELIELFIQVSKKMMKVGEGKKTIIKSRSNREINYTKKLGNQLFYFATQKLDKFGNLWYNIYKQKYFC